MSHTPRSAQRPAKPSTLDHRDQRALENAQKRPYTAQNWQTRQVGSEEGLKAARPSDRTRKHLFTLPMWGIVAPRSLHPCGGNMKGKSLLLAVSLMLLASAALAQLQPSPTLVKIMPHWAQQGFNPLNPSAVGHPVITANAMMANAIMNQFTVTN